MSFDGFLSLSYPSFILFGCWCVLSMEQKFLQIQVMRNEASLLPGQPQTHLTSNHWRECFLCEDYSLRQTEIQRLVALKEEANVLFQDQPRWDLVKALYSEYFQQQPKVSGKEWMRLGFQGQYPETDFRGGGVLSLQLILRFVKRNGALVGQMEKDKGGFFFAITAINIAFFMKKYFHLADFLVPGKDAQDYCDRRALKSFSRVMVDRQDAYENMHEVFLKYFYGRLWVEAQRSNASTLLQFNSLFNRLTTLIRDTFEKNDLMNYGQFESAWINNAQ